MAEGIIQWLKQIADNIVTGAGASTISSPVGAGTAAAAVRVTQASDSPGSTNALQTTGNASLASIDGKLATSIRPALVSLTPVLDTSIYADGEILFDTIVMASTFLSASGTNRLESIHVLDEDDQGVAFDLVFLNALTSLGTINVAPSISDANARNIIGFRSVSSADYIDLGGARIATPYCAPLVLATGATNLWVAGITRGGTPTYTASGLKLKFGFAQG